MAASAASSSGKEPSIDDMLKHLVLREDELEDVKIGADQVKEFKKEARWVVIAKIHGIPELYRKTWIVDDLARRIGKTREVQMSPKLFFDGNYVRLRVLIEVGNPLTRFVFLNIEGEGRKMLSVKYEKLPFFCRHCGLIGHDHEECGDGDWEEKDLQYGSWLLATRRSSLPAPEPRRFTARDRGRGCRPGRGGSNTQPRKHSSQEADLDAEEDEGETVTSPLKPPAKDKNDESDADAGARRNLNFDSPNTGDGSTENISEAEDAGVIPPPPPAYVDPRDRSKIRKTGGAKNDMATSAASSEEDRRVQ
ncbi:hypothetical protein ACQ4PT_016383 [Festuca glaucescens]